MPLLGGHGEHGDHGGDAALGALGVDQGGHGDQGLGNHGRGDGWVTAVTSITGAMDQRRPSHSQHEAAAAAGPLPSSGSGGGGWKSLRLSGDMSVG